MYLTSALAPMHALLQYAFSDIHGFLCTLFHAMYLHKTQLSDDKIRKIHRSKLNQLSWNLSRNRAHLKHDIQNTKNTLNWKLKKLSWNLRGKRAYLKHDITVGFACTLSVLNTLLACSFLSHSLFYWFRFRTWSPISILDITFSTNPLGTLNKTTIVSIKTKPLTVIIAKNIFLSNLYPSLQHQEGTMLEHNPVLFKEPAHTSNTNATYQPYFMKSMDTTDTTTYSKFLK